jgi:beta-galactosidase
MHLPWEVAYAPGELKAVAKKDGKIVATDYVNTAGDPATIELKPDHTTIDADGQDLSFITVRVLDKNGVVCPDADTKIDYAVSGPADIAGMDNGDATNHEPFQGHAHTVWHGLGLVVLKSRYQQGGKVTITATAAGTNIPAATTEINASVPK